MQDYVSRTSVSGGKQLEIKVTVDDRSGQKTFDATEQIVNAVKKGETSSNDMTGRSGRICTEQCTVIRGKSEQPDN
jgi:hypothetical protein